MTTVAASGSFPAAQAVWSRFIKSMDRDGDGSLSMDELTALSSQDKAEQAMARNDANGDGQLGADELPKGAFSPAAMTSLLSAQEYRDASPKVRAEDDARAVAALYARADVDGDGTLSQAEWDAERALNMANYADAGEAPQLAFLLRQGADTNALKPEDFGVGRRLELTPIAEADMPDGLREQIESIKAFMAQHEPETAAKSDTEIRAAMAGQVAAMPMSSAFLTRLIASLGEGALSGATA